MSAQSKMRKGFEAMLLNGMRAFGFTRQRKDFRDTYLKRTDEGHHGIVCQLDSRYDLSIYLRFNLRFDVAWTGLRMINQKMHEKFPGPRLPPDLSAYYDSIGAVFECHYELLAGIQDWTADSIETEEELEALYERTMARVHRYGMPYFAKYGHLATVLQIIDEDSQEWEVLHPTRGGFLVSAASTVYGVRGLDGLLTFLAKHEQDPELIDGVYCERMEMLVIACKEAAETYKA
ncbi:MAG TPA: hypothetical protein PKC45_19375 [Gemmatales bacterium]|nr:hypothetical protein [Gemmatales bacterium]